MNITHIKNQIATERQALLLHPLYQNIHSLEDLHRFLEGHVYAVWDFMSLLKALQNQLTCTTTPWFASSNPETRYLINEIVVAEESDITLTGKRLSHFEMYLEAMTDCQANTDEINRFLEAVQSTQNIFIAIKQSNLPIQIKEFLQFTFETIKKGKPHCIAAAFTFGREELIPDMFTHIIRNFKNNLPEINLDQLVYYFERHIELDGDDHGPKALQMVTELCGEDAQKWEEVAITSKEALQVRLGLWDAIYETVLKGQNNATAVV